MFLTRSEYDHGVNTFSPEGRLFQVEYAIEATKLGSTGISIQTADGVVLVVEKRITSPLIVPASIEKIFKIDDHIACAVSGLVADARTLIEEARAAAAYHQFSYNERMTVEDVTQSVSSSMLGFCKDRDEKKKRSLSRPYGVALLFAGIDEHGPALFHLDPSGTFIRYNAKAIGSGCEGAQQSLQDIYHSNMTLAEGCKHVLNILKQVMEEKLEAGNVEMATITKEKGFHLLSKEDVQNYITEIDATSRD